MSAHGGPFHDIDEAVNVLFTTEEDFHFGTTLPRLRLSFNGHSVLEMGSDLDKKKWVALLRQMAKHDLPDFGEIR